MSQTATVEPRLVIEQGLEARLAAIAEPVIEDLGFRLVRIKIIQHNGCIVQIMAERDNGTMSIADCESVSRNLSPVFDVEDPMTMPYHLEVSSPGIDRPLVRLSDFARWSGSLAKFELESAKNGRRRYKGTVLAPENGKVGLAIEQDGKDPAEFVWFAPEEIENARLVMTDALIAETLKANKKGNSKDQMN